MIVPMFDVTCDHFGCNDGEYGSSLEKILENLVRRGWEVSGDKHYCKEHKIKKG